MLPENLLWQPGCLDVLDQRCLPAAVRYLSCRRWVDVARAIAELAVRGAPAIGIAAAYGVALAASAGPQATQLAATGLIQARPTAVEPAVTVPRVLAAAIAGGPHAAVAEAVRIHVEDAARCERIAEFGSQLLAGRGWVLTHCHTGALATGGIGTALGAIRRGWEKGVLDGVYCCEARPLWQGARLTALECQQYGLPHALVVDGAVGWLLAQHRVGAVCVGADRIAVNGDVANKIGTLQLAIAAAHYGIPVYVFASMSTVDGGLVSGTQITIEERDADEVRKPHAPPRTPVWNPAFDVTPGNLVSAIVTETGIEVRPYAFVRRPQS